MYDVVSDRVFWIYFIIVFFFVIIGIGLIIASSDSNILFVAIIWMFSNVLLLIAIYHISLRQCTECYNWRWLVINLLFLLLLILGTVWTGELNTEEADSTNTIRTVAGILILIGGLILTGLATNYRYLCDEDNATPFWAAVGYLVIWFGLAMYVLLTE